MKTFSKKLVIATTLVVAASTNAMATVVPEFGGADVTISTAGVAILAGIVLIGGGFMWGVRKSIATTNKS